jgi:ParB/RepB/Spo0J family partition protein
MIATTLIDPSPDNPRASLGDVDELAESIRELGMISPVLVTANAGRYSLVYGHRRLAAAVALGLDAVPAIVSTDTDARRLRAKRLAENVAREDLTPLEEARAYHELLGLGVEGGQRGLAKLVGKSQGHISKRLGLLRLPKAVQDQVDSGRITLDDAGELTKLADDPGQVTKALAAGERAYGGVAGAVQRELRATEDRRQREAEAEQLRAAGVTVIDEPRTYSRQHGPYPLHSIPMTAQDHAGLDCHAAVMPSYGASAILVCLDPQAHLGAEDDAAERERLEAAAARAEREAARSAAAEARRSFGAKLVRASDPGVGAALLVEQLVPDRQWLPGHYREAAAELLGLNPDTFNGKDARDALGAYAAKGTRNAQRAIYALALALGESQTTRYDFEPSARIAYLDHLVVNGYTLGEVEMSLLGEDDDEGPDADEGPVEDDEDQGEAGRRA